MTGDGIPCCMYPARDSRCLLQTSPQVTNPSPAPSIDARVRRCVLEPHHSYIAPINEDAVPGVQVRVDAHRGGHRIESVDVIGIVEVGDNSVGAARGLKLNFFSNAHWDLRDRSVRSLMRGGRNPSQAYRQCGMGGGWPPPCNQALQRYAAADITRPAEVRPRRRD